MLLVNVILATHIYHRNILFFLHPSGLILLMWLISPMVHGGMLQGVYCDHSDDVFRMHFKCNIDAMVCVQEYMQVFTPLNYFGISILLIYCVDIYC
jgi:hypothetical protein